MISVKQFVYSSCTRVKNRFVNYLKYLNSNVKESRKKLLKFHVYTSLKCEWLLPRVSRHRCIRMNCECTSKVVNLQLNCNCEILKENNTIKKFNLKKNQYKTNHSISSIHFLSYEKTKIKLVQKLTKIIKRSLFSGLQKLYA